MFAQVVFIHKCFLMEEGSWEWWAHMCFLMPGSDLMAGVAAASFAVGAAWSLRQRRAA
jgi:hypothetical protein